MAKFKKKGNKMKYGGGAMVLHSGGGLAPAAAGPMLKPAPAGMLYEAAAVAAGRKWVTSELEKQYQEKARALGKKSADQLTAGEKSDVMRSLGWKLMGGGYIARRTFESGDMVGAAGQGAFVNGIILVTDSL